jgi:RloB-like protein
MSPKRGGEPRRRVSDTAKRRSILVFTEGKKTEPVYLTHWSRAYRERTLVTIDDFHGAPLSLVQEAAARRAADLKAARRGHGDAYSEYWCMFDIDEHPNVARALELAVSSGVSVSVTNPCVELWFLLHFQDQNAAIHRHDAQRKASDYLNCGKTPTSAALAALTSQYEDARRRAQDLDRRHELDGSPPRSNPSSEAWRLIETIRQAR